MKKETENFITAVIIAFIIIATLISLITSIIL
jgi:hypothetical protein